LINILLELIILLHQVGQLDLSLELATLLQLDFVHFKFLLELRILLLKVVKAILLKLFGRILALLVLPDLHTWQVVRVALWPFCERLLLGGGAGPLVRSALASQLVRRVQGLAEAGLVDYILQAVRAAHCD